MATNPTLLLVPIAQNGTKNTIPENQATPGNGLMSQSTGFPAECSLPLGAGGVAPDRADFNGAFNLLGGVAFYAQKGWQFLFDVGQDYYSGCIVRDSTDGQFYECLNDVAAGGNVPSSDTVNWSVCKYIIESYYDVLTGNWYRVYSDGWIEQGGTMTSTSTQYTFAINLNKAMADTKYTAVVLPRGGYNSWAMYLTNGGKTTTKLTVSSGDNTAYAAVDWFVAGKVASV